MPWRSAPTAATSPPPRRSRYPEATGRLALFVHGLCESDASWTMGTEQHHGDSPPTAPSCATTSASPRSTCATTPGAASTTTPATSPTCSRSWSRCGPSPSARSC
ncbi:MAG: hypothetical protein R2734_19725 [Nocardioides sp.]